MVTCDEEGGPVEHPDGDADGHADHGYADDWYSHDGYADHHRHADHDAAGAREGGDRRPRSRSRRTPRRSRPTSRSRSRSRPTARPTPRRAASSSSYKGETIGKGTLVDGKVKITIKKNLTVGEQPSWVAKYKGSATALPGEKLAHRHGRR